MPPRVFQERFVRQKHLALGRNIEAHAADFALVRDIARLDFHHQGKANAGDRAVQRALFRHQLLVGQHNADLAQQRFAIGFGERCGFQMRGDIVRR